ncbi:MAG: carbohydrate ABC transporter permease [Halobacterium sp.]
MSTAGVPPADEDEPPEPGRLDRVRAEFEDLTARRVGLYAVLFALAAFYLAPLESGVLTSIKTSKAFAQTIPFAPPAPGGFTTHAWEVAIREMTDGLVNSLFLAVPATILSAFLGSMTAYGLTSLNWRGQLGVVTLVIAGIFIPYQAVLVPLSRFWALVDLSVVLSQRWADLVELIVTHTAYGIPICTLLFRNHYQSFSEEMLEAARLDGASAFTIYRRIVLPLSLPMFAVTLIYQFTQVWNDLLFALILSNTPSSHVVTYDLVNLTGGIVQTFNTQMAGAFIAAVPTLLVYVFFGEQFAKGVAGEST